MKYVIAFIVIAVGKFGFGIDGTVEIFFLATAGFGLGAFVQYLIDKNT